MPMKVIFNMFKRPSPFLPEMGPGRNQMLKVNQFHIIIQLASELHYEFELCSLLRMSRLGTIAYAPVSLDNMHESYNTNSWTYF